MTVDFPVCHPWWVNKSHLRPQQDPSPQGKAHCQHGADGSLVTMRWGRLLGEAPVFRPKRLHCLQEFLPGMYMGPGAGHNPCCHLNSVPSLKCCFIFSLCFIFSSIKCTLVIDVLPRVVESRSQQTTASGQAQPAACLSK